MQNRNFISQCRKNITVEDNKKTNKETKKTKKIGANIANFTYLYYMSREKLKMEIIQ